MIKHYCSIIIVSLLLSTGLVAQFMPPDMGMGFLMDENNFENKVDAVEAMFINEIFVKNMMKSQSFAGFDDEEEQFMDNSQANEMVNSIMSYHMSKHLAEQLDLFGLDRQNVNYGEY